MNFSIVDRVLRPFDSGSEFKCSSKSLRLVAVLYSSLGTLSIALAAPPVHPKALTPEHNPWADHGIVSNHGFGAFYTRKNVDEEWHQLSRTDEFSDIMLRFPESENELVFWRGSSYLPHWQTKTNRTAFEEIIPRTGDGPADRPDKVNRYAHARIIESTPARVVIHWRYMPRMLENVGPNNLPDQTQLVDEYFVVFPDQTVLRSVLAGQPRYQDWRTSVPGRLFRYQLTESGVEKRPGQSADKELMAQVMGFANLEARVVLRWRYPLSEVGYRISYEDSETGWGNWSEWYFVIYPDGTVVKRLRLYMDEARRHEWQESMAIMGPDQRPEMVIDTTPALTLATAAGEIREYSWIDAPPKKVNYADAVLHVVNMKAEYDPYTIQRITGGDVYSARGGTGYSAFPAWNHWPVGQFLSDGRHAIFPDRTAHSSLTHIFWDSSVPFDTQGRFEEKLLLEGMSNRPAKDLLPLALSWLQPAPATTPTDGLAVAWQAADRAFVLTRASSEVKNLQLNLAGSPETPIHNPVVIVENWGQDRIATLTVNGKKPEPSLDIRQGVVTRANGVNALIIWIEHSGTDAMSIGIAEKN